MTQHEGDKMFSLGTRRLQYNGQALHINVPSTWCTHHNLTKGALLEAHVDDEGRLVITPARVEDE